MRTTITIIATIVAMLAVPAHGQQSTTFTDQRGNFAGSAVTRGNSTSFTDQRGDFAGSSIRHGDRIDFYDRNGRYQGTTTTTRPQR
jgi:hypothetical protein